MSGYSSKDSLLVTTLFICSIVLVLAADMRYTLSSNWSVDNDPAGSLRIIQRSEPTNSTFRIIFASSNDSVLMGFQDNLDGFSTLSIVLNPGNVIFNEYPYQLVWSANMNNPVGVNAILKMSGGNLVLQDNNTHEVWSTNLKDGESVSGINVQDSGNVVLYDTSNRTVWQSFDHPTDTILLGSSLNHTMALVAGSSATNSSEGLGFRMVMEAKALVFYTTKGLSMPGQPYWIIGQSNVSLLTDAVTPYPSYPPGLYGYTELFLDLNDSYATFLVTYPDGYPIEGQSFLTRNRPAFLRLDSDGRLRWYSFDITMSFPAYYWFVAPQVVPYKVCSLPTSCGAYGICSSTYTQICNCPNGEVGGMLAFQPRNSSDLTQGCYPTHQWNCDVNTISTDFTLLELKGVTYFQNQFVIPLNATIDECKQRCLKNCSFAAAFYANDTNSCYLVEDVLTMQNTADANYTAFLKVKAIRTGARFSIWKLGIALSIGGVFAIIVIVLAVIWRRITILQLLLFLVVSFFKNSNHVGYKLQSDEPYLELAKRCLTHSEEMILSKQLQLNHGQCEYLLRKLEEAVQTTNVSPAHGGAVCIDILKLLFRLANEVESFVKDCCKDDWIHAAIFMANVSQHVSLLCIYLDLYTALIRTSNVVGVPLSIQSTAEPNLPVNEIASLDQSRLVERLLSLIRSTGPSDRKGQLGTYLLNRLTAANSSQQRSDFLQLSHWKIDYSSLKRNDQKLGKGAAATVHKAIWLGAEVAEKAFVGSNDDSFQREVSILAGKSHPNIAALLCYAMDPGQNSCSIVMELMDKDLNSLMRSRQRFNKSHGAPFPILEAVDIMLQVADGLYYLHKQRVVHRDLKSFNVLVKCVKPGEVKVEFVHAKVADFGLSKTKESSYTYSNQSPNIGSTRWMAPESYKMNSVQEELKNPFKRDVYSFAMVCFEILTGELPFQSISSLREVRRRVIIGQRPQLPSQCPPELRSLIERCWSADLDSRPSFADILKVLRRLKCSLLIGKPLPNALLGIIMDQFEG